MKKLFTVLSVCILFSTHALAAQPRFVRVNAEAEVLAAPDRVTITVGYTQKTKNLQEGASALQKNIAQALAYCKSQNIKDKNLQTQNLSITPTYVSSKNQEKLEPSFLLSQSFSATLEDLSQYESFLYGLLNNGVNNVQEVRFFSSQLKEYRNQARILAMQNARDKAALLAQEAGAQLGKVISITEEPQRGVYGISNISQNVYSAAGTAVAGSIPVRAEVSVQYELK